MDMMGRVTPKGYYTFGDYIGFMPDGSTQKFESEKEYSQNFKEILDEEMERRKKNECK